MGELCGGEHIAAVDWLFHGDFWGRQCGALCVVDGHLQADNTKQQPRQCQTAPIALLNRFDIACSDLDCHLSFPTPSFYVSRVCDRLLCKLVFSPDGLWWAP